MLRKQNMAFFQTHAHGVLNSTPEACLDVIYQQRIFLYCYSRGRIPAFITEN
ncbi:hypothetical protein Hanom_Chr16g01452641 [Helianthus anomalus]